jgi:hypothetical protein
MTQEEFEKQQKRINVSGAINGRMVSVARLKEIETEKCELGSIEITARCTSEQSKSSHGNWHSYKTFIGENAANGVPSMNESEFVLIKTALELYHNRLKKLYEAI